MLEIARTRGIFSRPDARSDLLFTMSENPHAASATREKSLLLDEKPDWWSQTGSNRRPPACKAGALPAELWPLSYAPQSGFRSRLSAGSPSRSSRSLPRACASEGWWAWEDLNFRPHAYQARALTN